MTWEFVDGLDTIIDANDITEDTRLSYDDQVLLAARRDASNQAFQVKELKEVDLEWGWLEDTINDSVITPINTVIGGLNSLLSDMADTLSYLETTVTNIATVMGKVTDIPTFISTIQQKIVDLYSEMQDFLADPLNWVEGKFAGIGTKMEDLIEEYASRFKDVIMRLMHEVVL